MLLYTFALLGIILDALYYCITSLCREARLISATQPRKNEEAAATGSSRSMGCTTVQLWFVLEPDFCLFFTLWAWHNMDDHGRGQNIAIQGKC